MELRRKKLGLIFSNNIQWIGGTYYIINLIHALSILEDNLKPELIILSNEKDYQFLLQQIDYPYIYFMMFNNVYSK